MTEDSERLQTPSSSEKQPEDGWKASGAHGGRVVPLDGLAHAPERGSCLWHWAGHTVEIRPRELGNAIVHFQKML